MHVSVIKATLLAPMARLVSSTSSLALKGNQFYYFNPNIPPET